MIKIYTIQFNDPDFLEYQFLTFKRFIKEEHQLICINNSETNAEAIRKRAEDLGIQHYFPEDIDHSKGGYAHQTAIMWAWRKFIVDSTDINVIVDHDMFLIKEFSPDLNYDIMAIMQGRGEYIKYFHPGFIVINSTLKDRETVDFKGEEIDGQVCDSGGNWHHYIVAHPDLKVKSLSLVNISEEHNNLNILPDHYMYNEADALQICEDFMLHFRNGSNWAHTKKEQYDRKKEQLINALITYMK